MKKLKRGKREKMSRDCWSRTEGWISHFAYPTSSLMRTHFIGYPKQMQKGQPWLIAYLVVETCDYIFTDLILFNHQKQVLRAFFVSDYFAAFHQRTKMSAMILACCSLSHAQGSPVKIHSAGPQCTPNGPLKENKKQVCEVMESNWKPVECSWWLKEFYS